MSMFLTLLRLMPLPAANAADTFAGSAFYYGDPHAHTGLSHDGYATDVGAPCLKDGDCAAFADVFRTAVDNGLDWVVLSDHVNGSSDYAASAAEFQQLIDADLHHDDPGASLLVIPGAEVWFHLDDGALGHKNLLLFGNADTLNGLALSDVVPPELTSCDDITAWMDDLTLAFGDAVLIPHHSMATRPMPTDWSCHTDYEPTVEIYSAWGNSLGADDGYDEPKTPEPAGSVLTALDPEGYALRMGFVGGTDAHTTQPGRMCRSEVGIHVSSGALTMAVLDAGEPLDAAALYDAMTEHRTLATTGPRVPVVVTLSDDDGTTWTLGRDVTLPADRTLTVSVAVDPTYTAAVTAVWFTMPDGHLVLEPTGEASWGTTIAADDVPAWGYAGVQFSAASLGLCDDGNGTDEDWIWASPSYITRTDVDRDADGAGYLTGDCDDADPTVHPNAAEGVADGVDADCDGLEACYVDADADGHRTDGVITSASLACDAPGIATATAPDDDCDDADPAVFPGAPELPGDGVDADCDGMESCYVDDDADGARTDAVVVTADLACAGPGLAAARAPDDCDDADPTTYVGAPELDCTDPVDHDCDGAVRYADDDADGWAACLDCDDADADVFPGAWDAAGDGLDADCDGLERCYADADGDGHRTAATVESTDAACDGPGEAPADAPDDDCDDADPAVSPDAAELPGDGIDNDCDTVVLCYVDADADGHRTDVVIASTDAACAGPGEAAASAPDDDCDDTDPAVFPGATEIPGDGVDADCDGLEACYVDADGDGYVTGDGATVPSADRACASAGLASAAAPGGDCDDADARRHPDAAEADCTDPNDWNCDGSVDWADADGDGWAACADCDDAAADVHPGAVDAAADGLDADCDGLEVCLIDADQDGWPAADGGPSAETTDDVRCVAAGHLRAEGRGGDCDDADPSVHPDAAEAPGDGVDADCDDLERCYVDADGDGYRSADGATAPSADLACGGPGLTDAGAPVGDCDDADPAAHPDAAESPSDGVDADCDGLERCYVDADGDGYRSAATLTAPDCAVPGAWTGGRAAIDCDDDDARIGPCRAALPDQADTGDTGAPDTGAPHTEPTLTARDCGCATGSGAPPSLLGLGLAWMAARRRR